MKHIAAYALLTLAGKENITADDVERYLKEAGVSSDSESIKLMISKFEGKKFHELVKGGLDKLATLGSAAPAGGAGPAGGKAAEVKAAVEEKKEEVEDVDMGGLFGGDDEY